MDRQAVRPSEEIPVLRQKCQRLEERANALEATQEATNRTIEHLLETLSQFQSILECGLHPAPVFLRWEFTTDDGCRIARAAFGKYRLEVVDGRSSVGWDIKKGDHIIDAGGHPCSIDSAMDDCEEALRRLVQAEKPKG